MKWQQKLIIASTFTWLGFLCAISFMEAWLKFQAPGITVELGLGIGRLVFGALNKVELTLAFVIVVFGVQELRLNWKFISLWVTLAILMLQTFYLLPTLDERASLLLSGVKPEKSYLHVIYILTEGMKAVCLIAFGFKLFHKNKTYDSVL